MKKSVNAGRVVVLVRQTRLRHYFNAAAAGPVSPGLAAARVSPDGLAARK